MSIRRLISNNNTAVARGIDHRGLLRVVHVTASLSRKGGGVYPALRELTEHQAECGALVSLMGLKDAYTVCDVNCYDNIHPYAGVVCGPKAYGYSPRLRQHLFGMSDLEVVHCHGLWMYPSYLARRFAARRRVPLIISPHGMLDSWALKNSAWKKKMAGWLFENRNLGSAKCIHALCESEYKSIRAYGLKNPVCIIPNGVALPDLSTETPIPLWEPQVDRDKKVMLFLGRIHPKKGLENLIRAWGILTASKSPESGQWYLAIAGWNQGIHEDELKRLAHELGIETNILFAGPLYDTAKDKAFRAAKAFILPSFSEGLPMAVLEAWSYCLPVIMTEECNIPQGFASGAAVDIRPEVDSIARVLKSFFSLPDPKRRVMGFSGRSLVEKRFSWPRIAGEMIGVYQWILGQRPRPECVRLN